MAIPVFEDFFYPFLKFIGQKDMTSKEMKQAIISYFHLTEQDSGLLTRGGKTTQLDDRPN